MEKVIMRTQIWLGAVLLFAMSALGSRTMAGESLLEGIHWRPMAIPNIAKTNSTVTTQAIKDTLTYADGDEDKVLALAFRLPKADAVSTLCQYIERYEKDNSLTGQAWGRAVFCLGLVQTELARNYLYKLWERHDQRLKLQKKPLKITDMSRSVSPLSVIGDALHFYLSEEGTRKWFLERISEAERMPLSTEFQMPSFRRKIDRDDLIRHLYRWDLIESVDGEFLLPRDSNKVLRIYPLLPAYQVENIQLSADRLVHFVKNLPPLRLDATEGQWCELRRPVKEFALSSTAAPLGMPLALAIWGKYLHQSGTTIDNGQRYKLWMTTLWASYHGLLSTEVGKWVPNSEQRSLLDDALAYAGNLPQGHLRYLATKALWGVTCFADEKSELSEVLAVRAFAIENLDQATRNGMLELIEMNSPLRNFASKKADRNNSTTDRSEKATDGAR